MDIPPVIFVVIHGTRPCVITRSRARIPVREYLPGLDAPKTG